MRKAAVFTIVHNEKVFFPLWLKHYSKYFEACDIYVLDHGTADGSLEGSGFNKREVVNSSTFDHSWLLVTVQNYFRELLLDYEYVLFAEADEFIEYLDGGLRKFIDSLTKESVLCKGFEPVQKSDEFSINWNEPILQQRKFHRWNSNYNKILLANFPLEWSVGFHRSYNSNENICESNLYLAHLRYVDFQILYDRIQSRLDLPFSECDKASKLGWQNSNLSMKEFVDNWPTALDVMSEDLKGII